MKIFQLRPAPPSHSGLFSTVEKAKGVAAAMLREWHAFSEIEAAKGEDAYPLTTELEWRMELPTDWPARPGQEVLTAWYCKKYAFTIYERQVD